ncbi:LysM peptidoglycan-binding domain-containing protein [Oceanobacillus salinisoli]|uniref:LysM peptidoglycan-binding domain-containing protein n=1 Tax=Oceanobacillus salinisoli TaxID=2678611 RepID=UPI0018CC58C6|nr:LysM peptidoglycan-binding domain-containing protein [Oceanobacillus salinisoli]
MNIKTNSHVIYTVQPGDTLNSIAARFASDIQSIARANHLYPPVTDPYLIFPEQVLVVPIAGNGDSATFYIVSQNERLFDIAQRFSVPTESIAVMNQLKDPNLIYIGQSLRIPALIYDIEPTDTMNGIANRFQVSVEDILRANWQRPGFSASTIWPGYSIIIPQ